MKIEHMLSGEDGEDYTVVKDEAVWITVGNKSVHVKHGDDGVSVTVYELNEEDCDSVTEAWAEW